MIVKAIPFGYVNELRWFM